MKLKKGGACLSALLLLASSLPVAQVFLALPCLADDPQVQSDWAVDDPNRKPAVTEEKPKSEESGGTSLVAPVVPPAAGESAKSDSPASSTDALDMPMVAPVMSPATQAVINSNAKQTIEKGAVTATATVKPAAPSQTIQASASSAKLYGRIEQIAGGKGANFPIVFKAAVPSLDTSLAKPALKGGAQDLTVYSGTVAKSFPEDYRGTWGGSLKVWTVEQAPVCFQIDPEEAGKVQRIFKSGAEGSVNFMFANDTKGGIYLAPAQIMFQVAGKEVGLEKQMTQMMGGQSLSAMGPMGQMMAQMAQSMPVPIIFSFGDIQTNSMAKGLSGNEFVQRTLRNTVRQLTPQVIEQQIIAQMNEVMKSTGRPRLRYEESVIRFTKVNAQQMYVQAAQVVYGPDRKFQQKIIMYGYVTKGQVVNTNPYSGMMQMPGMMQIPGQAPGTMPQMRPGTIPSIPGLTPGQNPFGGGNGGSIPGLPPGFNPFQGLFGQ
ncbi:MAG TPA: hypothetical protein PLC15_10130 [Candidatus Obscuribacter sp.]|nr:hypothetical protein [Candidatus Obscuribacter sp.]HMX45303.1 hypothetical protein [Candidatus Obscuribacter sp.]HNA72081.1 hypothetical protein [Candidatus Obscuribacter sp.]HNB15731.1 hypothetical protein [Candidatus Obscuribacter sp.]HND07399.1 hypothetical protein [Candidatus Obscuribacter sp.]